jgi:hypothetical protein
MDEARDTPGATDKDDAAMLTFSDAAATLGKWVGHSDLVPTQFAAVIGLALGTVWRR